MKSIVLDLTGAECPRCKRDLISAKQWRTFGWDFKKELKKNFTPGPVVRGLCLSCYTHLHHEHRDDLADYERTTRSYQEFAEEYTAMKESGMTDTYIAETLGMISKNQTSPSGRLNNLNKAIKRCKEKGYL